MNETEYLRLLTYQAEQTNLLLSNSRKWERERWVCQRLLQALNIDYHSDEFGTGQEPPDVRFRDACFEVFMVIDVGRRLNDEWRDELRRRRSAYSLNQLRRHEAHPKRINADELQSLLGPTLRKKARNYRVRDLKLGELDMLAYIDLKHAVPDFNTSFPPPTEYLHHGWRSLSMVGPTFARVLFAHGSAPDFLRNNLGRCVLFDAGSDL
ncbi:DUF1780 domain-containing protein [Pseudomonas sp. LS44]|uniref:DUF1780 domain-containing protein n=1 Tax=Pseudomonas sp. LS44 TaxID=1357074 RepID=UPI00215ACAC5|nr:DUF1780 domain-containing protein [Pseudomonas sp. LS44]UVE18513.1 DUF1780 domain-containing protein [Pseudomonas sp. LS44]